MEKIGLIAGGGRFPVVFAEKARNKGAKVICFAIKGMASSEIDKTCDKVHWLEIGQLKKFLFLLITERIKELVMIGKFDKSVIYKNKDREKDSMTEDILKNMKTKNDYSLLEEITKKLEKVGVKVIDGVKYVPDLLPSKGVLTKRLPTESEKEDVEYGTRIAKELARLDVGQVVVVKQKNVCAVESMEGTDETIKRAAGIIGGGFIVCKVARPDQDMRWDVPIVGGDTIRTIADCKGSVLSLEAEKMFFLDKEEVIRLADENDISIVVV